MRISGWALMVAAAVLPAVLHAMPGVARAEHYEIFILAGQSNMDGRGEAAKLTGELKKYAEPLEGVSIVYNNAEKVFAEQPQPLAPGYSVPPGKKDRELEKDPAKMTFGPEVGFGHAIKAAMPGKKILLIKSSKGGTGLKRDWWPETEGSLYHHMISLVTRTTDQLKKDGDTWTIHGFIWHQGESDNVLPAGEYEKLFTTFAEHLRKDLKLPELPIVLGELADNGTRENVMAGFKELVKKLPHTGLASVKGLKTIDPATHFDAASQITLGQRCAEEVMKLIIDAGAETKPAK